MNIVRIFKKEFYLSMKDYKIMLLMTLFPILLIYMIGTAFGGVDSRDVYGVEKLAVDLYKADESDSVESTFVQLQNELETKLNLGDRMNESVDLERSLDDLSKNRIDALIEIREDEIILHKNETFYQQFTVIEALVKSVSASEINGDDFSDAVTQISQIENTKYQSILDYFGLAFMILFILYGVSNSVVYTVKERVNQNTARILQAPISVFELVIGKVLAFTAVCILQVLIVFASTIVFFNVNWGGRPLQVLPLIFSLVLVVIASGVFVGFAMNSEGAAVGIIHTLIVVFAFFGGCYMPLRGIGTMGEIGKYFTPVWWTIEGVIDMIYFDSLGKMYASLAINLGFTLVFVLLTLLIVKRREVKA